MRQGFSGYRQVTGYFPCDSQMGQDCFSKYLTGFWGGHLLRGGWLQNGRGGGGSSEVLPLQKIGGGQEQF